MLSFHPEKHHYLELLSIGIPIIIGQLGTIILGFADTLMIGHHSTEELAAAGLVNNLFTMVLLFYLGFSYGLTPIVGRLFGMEKTDEIGQKVKNSLVANMALGGVLTIVMTILYFNIHHIGQPDDLLDIIRPYFLVNLASILFVGCFNTIKQLFDGIGDTKVAMWAMIAGNCLNIVFNWLLIYGVGVFPELGLLGAGISTLGSRVFMMCVLIVSLLTARRYRTYRKSFMAGTLNRCDMAEMNRLGLPVALQLGMESGAFTLSCVMAGWLGIIPLAAHQVMITISQLFYLILSGMAAATSIRISHFFGQNDLHAVKTSSRDGFHIVLFCSILLSIPALLLRNDMGGYFNDNAEVQHTVSLLTFILVIYQFGDGLQYTYANSLRGIACVKPMVYYAFIAYFVISLPLGYFFGFVLHWGIYGIWAAFPFGLTSAGFLYRRRFYKELTTLNFS